jgi:hypothetical protein
VTVKAGLDKIRQVAFGMSALEGGELLYFTAVSCIFFFLQTILNNYTTRQNILVSCIDIVMDIVF